jgi:phosphatidylserine decarboxylase
VVSAGACERGTILQVKNKPISVDRLVHGAGPSTIDLAPFASYVTIFLTPRGYHHVHCPIDARVEDVRWIPGRFFPQNEDALQHVDAIYERNERAVLRLTTALGPMILVMVGASLIGGIHLRDAPRDTWVKRTPTPLGVEKKKGEALGHFTFGSTVVMLLPHSPAVPPAGTHVRMGQTL